MRENLSSTVGKLSKVLIFALKYGTDDEKQWALEEALRMITGDEWADGAKADFKWNDGIKFEI